LHVGSTELFAVQLMLRNLRRCLSSIVKFEGFAAAATAAVVAAAVDTCRLLVLLGAYSIKLGSMKSVCVWQLAMHCCTACISDLDVLIDMLLTLLYIAANARNCCNPCCLATAMCRVALCDVDCTYAAAAAAVEKRSTALGWQCAP
jgi:hypothetical protein